MADICRIVSFFTFHVCFVLLPVILLCFHCKKLLAPLYQIKVYLRYPIPHKHVVEYFILAADAHTIRKFRDTCIWISVKEEFLVPMQSHW